MSLYMLLKEQIANFYLLNKLAIFQLKSDNKNNMLGVLWEFLNPLIQIFMYWFVFGLGIRGNAEIDGVSFVYWMLAGIVMWFFVNAAILEGTRSMYQKYSLVSKMNFPLTVIPGYVVMSKLYIHLIMLSMILIIFWISGYLPSIYYLQLIYFIVFTYVFSYAVALLASTLAVIVRDVHLLVQAGLRVLFFVSPILWLPDRLPEFVQKLIQLNPFYYLANGYRASLLYDDWYIISHWQLTLYNVAFVLILLIIGSSIHFKMRDRFADYV
ncbi:ABC transporter permease [Solibacillus sp. FSL K6-1523]|uniref:ABC transporter permease n=1 Tax=Solibacillus sp. FSL K6-1523 TaxID=2921471 RepID=UPI0030F7D6F2